MTFGYFDSAQPGVDDSGEADLPPPVEHELRQTVTEFVVVPPGNRTWIDRISPTGQELSNSEGTGCLPSRRVDVVQTPDAVDGRGWIPRPSTNIVDRVVIRRFRRIDAGRRTTAPVGPSRGRRRHVRRSRPR
jgi:hypothetical protein